MSPVLQEIYTDRAHFFNHSSKGGFELKKFFSHIEEYICAVSLLIMLVITFANVISRKFLGQSWSFAEEITANLFILSSMLGAAIAAKRGAHMGLSALTDLLPKKAQRYVSLITTLAAIVFSIFLLYQGFGVVAYEMKTGQTTPALGWPEWIFGTFVPIGGVFLLIRFVEFGIKAFKEV